MHRICRCVITFLQEHINEIWNFVLTNLSILHHCLIWREQYAKSIFLSFDVFGYTDVVKSEDVTKTHVNTVVSSVAQVYTKFYHQTNLTSQKQHVVDSADFNLFILQYCTSNISNCTVYHKWRWAISCVVKTRRTVEPNLNISVFGRKGYVMIMTWALYFATSCFWLFI